MCHDHRHRQQYMTDHATKRPTMHRRETTLHDVARHVGVSPRTVSRVVNDEGGFSEATRHRVSAAIQELGYRPNLLARGLITRRSDTIGLVGTDMTDPFFPELADGVQRAANDVGLTMFFASTDGDVERQAAVLDKLRSHGVDGVILFPAPGSRDQVRAFARAGLSIVTVDDPMEGPHLAAVASDIEVGAALGVGHLVATGRSRIAMLAIDAGHGRRLRGYRSALPDGSEPIIEYGEATSVGGAEAMARVLGRTPDVDAVFAFNDLMAIGALRVLHQQGRRVPDDVAVVGFDDIGLSSMVTPALTTVHLDRERVGREAVSCLRAMADDPDGTREPVILPVELVIREST